MAAARKLVSLLVVELAGIANVLAVTCPGFPGYCSESFPGQTCVVVCSKGRNNVPLCQEDGTWTDIPRCVEHEPGVELQVPGICPGIAGYCSEGFKDHRCTFACSAGAPIDSRCTEDGTWRPYPTCAGDLRELQDGCDPCPGPNGRSRNRTAEAINGIAPGRRSGSPRRGGQQGRVARPTFAGSQVFGRLPSGTQKPSFAFSHQQQPSFASSSPFVRRRQQLPSTSGSQFFVDKDGRIRTTSTATRPPLLDVAMLPLTKIGENAVVGRQPPSPSSFPNFPRQRQQQQPQPQPRRLPTTTEVRNPPRQQQQPIAAPPPPRPLARQQPVAAPPPPPQPKVQIPVRIFQEEEDVDAAPIEGFFGPFQVFDPNGRISREPPPFPGLPSFPAIPNGEPGTRRLEGRGSEGFGPFSVVSLGR